MSKITKIIAREVLDSRANPTVESFVYSDGLFASAIVPSGASTGAHEALELRDKDSRYGGKGVQTALSNIQKIIAPKLMGIDATKQHEIDSLLCSLDGTENKSKLGANAMLAVSMACCKLGAMHNKMPLYSHIQSISKTKTPCLPIPMLNIINGGKHAGMENDIQEHMIMPYGFDSFKEGLRAGTEVYHLLGKILKKKFGAQATLLGDEGGFAPKVTDMHERLGFIMQAIRESGYEGKMKLALDCASSEFYADGKYSLGNKKYSNTELTDFYKDLVSKYPIVSIEDGMAEDDWEGWQAMQKELGDEIQIVGDDLLVTNTKRINTAIEKKACNALLLKVNQIGTVSESIDSAHLSYKNNWNVVVSHRSGETEDTFIADLVVGLGSGQSKFGAPARSERTAKYNQLLRIEEELGSRAQYGKRH